MHLSVTTMDERYGLSPVAIVQDLAIKPFEPAMDKGKKNAQTTSHDEIATDRNEQSPKERAYKVYILC